MTTPLASQHIQFARDSRTLVVADREAVTILDLQHDERRQVSIPAVQSIAAFADQVWVMTHSGILIRLALDGRRLDERQLSIDPDAQLSATSVGPATAYWLARNPVAVIDDLGALVLRPLDDTDVIPILGRRFARHAGSRLTLPETTHVTLSNGARIMGGAVVHDGTSIALVTEHAGGREIVVHALGSGRFMQRVTLPTGRVTVAARRGLAIVQDAPRRLVAFDLKFGVQTRTIVTDDDVIDVAVDPEGTVLALRLACGQLELTPIAEPVKCKNATARVSPTSSPPADAKVTPQPPLDAVASEPPAWSANALAEAVARFEPRPALDRLSRAQALEALEHELTSVRLWTLCAIADAWNSRQLSFGNEGAHPHEHEVAALCGMSGGFAPDHVANAEAALAAHQASIARDPQHRCGATPVGDLAAELGLSQRALDVLLVVAAPAVHGDVARLYGILCNDPGRPLVDEALVHQILARRMSRHEVAAELHASSPLVRLGVLAASDPRPRPFTGLEVDPVILSRLRAEPVDLGHALASHRSGATIETLEIRPSVLATAIDALARAARPARIAVHGRPGSGRRSLLASLAQRAFRSIAVLDATLLPRDAERFATALRTALRRAHLAGLIPVISGLESVDLDEHDGADLSREVLLAHPGPLAIIGPTDAYPPLAQDHVRIDLPPLTETERLDVWQRAIARTRYWLRDPAGLASRYRVGPGTIHRAVAAVTNHEPTTPCDDRLESFLRHNRDRRLASHTRKVERLASWSDLVLPGDVMDSLRELVGRVRHRRTVYEVWGMGRTMHTSRGLTALFQGPPGTGKTLVAGVIARELGLDLYQVELSKIVSKWLGETERNLATVFDAAEDGQVILLFDEADSLFAKRTEVRSSNDRYANLEVNYLLQRLDAFEGIAIMTTNNAGSIDPAFKRRLSFQLSFPFPDEETRLELWRTHLPRELPRAGDLTFDVLARKYQLSGGYIRNACLRAAFLAAQEETSLQQAHLERAVALEFAELGKLTTSGPVG